MDLLIKNKIRKSTSIASVFFMHESVYLIKILDKNAGGGTLKAGDENMNKNEIKIDEIVEKYKEKTKKECYEILLWDKKPGILDNKLGGKPYLPIGVVYPRDSQNEPMNLLLQVNLKDIKLKNFPDSGILEIFTNMGDEFEYKVFLFKEGLPYQKKFPKIKNFVYGEEVEYFVKKPIFITLEKTFMHMPTTNYNSYLTIKKCIEEIYNNKFKDNDELRSFVGGDDEFWEILENINNNIVNVRLSLGGYPNFAQYDPREELKRKKDECLFSLDPIGKWKYIDIIDSGTIWGFVSKEKLAKTNFSDVYIGYDFC